jgi:acyl-CoA synthetase (AMP-forming)/AMP-acid ligase II
MHLRKNSLSILTSDVTDTITYCKIGSQFLLSVGRTNFGGGVCAFVGVLMTGHTIFPVSPRNSPVAIAHLLRKAGATHLLIGREPVFQALVTLLTSEIRFQATHELQADASLQSHSDEHPSNDPLSTSVNVSHMPVFEDLFSENCISTLSTFTSDSSSTEDQDARRFPIPPLDLHQPAFILHSSGMWLFRPVATSLDFCFPPVCGAT